MEERTSILCAVIIIMLWTVVSEGADPCDPNPCIHASSCYPEHSRLGYKCNCLQGYGGKDCQSALPICTYSLCSAENTVVCYDYYFDYQCVCKEGYRGKNCDEIDACNPDPCIHSVRCNSEGSSGYKCDCLQGYAGINCQTALDPCGAEVCGEHSVKCYDYIFDYDCICEPGYTGHDCDQAIPEGPTYIGCFKDTWNRDLGATSVTSTDNSPEKCKTHCLSKGYRFAGVQYGTRCFCDDRFGKYGQLPETDCNKPCPNLSAPPYCGGSFANNVYSTDMQGVECPPGSGERCHLLADCITMADESRECRCFPGFDGNGITDCKS